MKNSNKILTLALFLGAITAQATEIEFETDPSLPVVHLNVALKAGSVNDPADQLGITQFATKMLLRGTKQRTKEQIDLELDQMGATLEVETRAEATILRGSVLAAQLDPFLRLVREIVTQPSFPENEIRKLKGETISEIMSEIGKDSKLLGLRFTKFLFRDHPYGRPIAGTQKTVGAFTREKVLAQYQALFKAPHLLIVGTGDAARGLITAWGEQLGKDLKPGPNWKPVARVAAPENRPARELLIVDKPDLTQTHVSAGQIGMRMNDADFFPVYLGNHAFGGGSFSARLMTEIRVKRGWSYGAASYFRHGLQPRSWQIYYFPAAKDTVGAVELGLKMIEDLRQSGITQEEYDFSKASLVNSAGFMYNTSKKRVENTLLEKTLDLPVGFMKTYADRLNAVSLAQVNAALKKYLHPDRLSVGVLCTAKDLKDGLIKAAGVTPDKVRVQSYLAE